MKEVTKMASTSFDIWMASVDAILEEMVGLSYEDQPDQPYRRWHSEGWSAAEAVKEVLNREGYK